MNINEMQMSNKLQLLLTLIIWNILVGFSPLDSPEKYKYLSV